MSVTSSDIKALNAVRMNLFVAPQAGASEPTVASDTASVSLDATDATDTSTAGASVAVPGVLLGAIGVASTISFLMARSIYHKAVYEASHPQVYLLPEYDHLPSNQSDAIPLHCINFSKSSMAEIGIAMGSLGAVYVPKMVPHTHLWTAGSGGGWNIGGAGDGGGSKADKRTSNIMDDDAPGREASPSGPLRGGSSRPSSWEAADAAAGAAGGKAVVDCKMRALEAHSAVCLAALRSSCEGPQSALYSQLDSLLEHFVHNGSRSVPPSVPDPFVAAVRQTVLTESFQVLIDGKEPDVFSSVRQLAVNAEGRPISLVYHLALTVDGSNTKVFSGVSKGVITGTYVREAIEAGVPDGELTHEMLFHRSYDSFEAAATSALSAGVVSETTPCVPARVALPRLLQYALLHNHYADLESDLSTALGLDGLYDHRGVIGKLFDSLHRTTSADAKRKRQLLSELVNSTGRAKYFSSPRTTAFLQLALYLKFGSQLDPVSHPWLESASTVLLGRDGDSGLVPSQQCARQATGDTLKVRDALSSVWRRRAMTTLCGGGAAGMLLPPSSSLMNASVSGTFAVTIRFLVPRVRNLAVAALRRRMIQEVMQQYIREEASPPIVEVVDEDGSSYPAPIYELRYHVDAHSLPQRSGPNAKSGASVREAIFATHHQAHILATIGASVDSVNVDLIVDANPTPEPAKGDLVRTATFFVSEKQAVLGNGRVNRDAVRLLNCIGLDEVTPSVEESGESVWGPPLCDAAHMMCRKRGVCPLYLRDAMRMCWCHPHQYFTFSLHYSAGALTADDITHSINLHLQEAPHKNVCRDNVEVSCVYTSHQPFFFQAQEASLPSSSEGADESNEGAASEGRADTNHIHSRVDCRFYRVGYFEARDYMMQVILPHLKEEYPALSHQQGPHTYSVYEALCSK